MQAWLNFNSISSPPPLSREQQVGLKILCFSSWLGLSGDRYPFRNLPRVASSDKIFSYYLGNSKGFRSSLSDTPTTHEITSVLGLLPETKVQIWAGTGGQDQYIYSLLFHIYPQQVSLTSCLILYNTQCSTTLGFNECVPSIMLITWHTLPHFTLTKTLWRGNYFYDEETKPSQNNIIYAKVT